MDRETKTNMHTVSYFIHEGDLARMERINKRLACVCAANVLLIPLLQILLVKLYRV